MTAEAMPRPDESADVSLRLCLLRAPRAIVAGDEVKLERKDALFFAWLAIEGPTQRARLASLLYPDADEAGARAALRQRMYRVRKSALAALVASDDPCRLDDRVAFDHADLIDHRELL